jgi:3-oxoacyl-[acyl-carrier protein] reductase
MKKLKKVADEIGAIPLSFDISDLKSIPQKAKEVTDFIDGN